MSNTSKLAMLGASGASGEKYWVSANYFTNTAIEMADGISNTGFKKLGDYIYISTRRKYNGQYKAYIAKHDLDGNVVWEKTIGPSDASSNTFEAYDIDADGTYVYVVGGSNYDYSDAFLASFNDSNGSFNYIKTYSTYTYGAFNSVKIVGGNLIVGGSDGHGYDAWVGSLSASDGSFNWGNRIVDDNTSKAGTISKIYDIDGSDFLFFGNNGQYGSYIGRSTVSGTLVYLKKFGQFNNAPPRKSYYYDGTYGYVASGSNYSGYPNYRPYIAKFQVSDGSLVWQKHVDATGLGGNGASFGSVAVDGSGQAYCVMPDNNTGTTHIFVYDSSGAVTYKLDIAGKFGVPSNSFFDDADSLYIMTTGYDNTIPAHNYKIFKLPNDLSTLTDGSGYSFSEFTSYPELSRTYTWGDWGQSYSSASVSPTSFTNAATNYVPSTTVQDL